MGAGVQHLALQTDDIFKTARLLKEHGAQTLPIPANYYEDLQARFDLDSALIERLAANDILYEREGQGEYFQLFTRAFASAFSSRSCSGVVINPTARATPPFVSPRNRAIAPTPRNKQVGRTVMSRRLTAGTRVEALCTN